MPQDVCSKALFSAIEKSYIKNPGTAEKSLKCIKIADIESKTVFQIMKYFQQNLNIGAPTTNEESKLYYHNYIHLYFI